jgi:small subunit ribosomal protein S2
MGGVRDMKRLPDLLFIIDPHKEEIAVEEAKKLHIPIVAITDTNCDPDKIDFIIPGNDDAIRSCNLITSIICDAVKKGKEEKIKIEKSPEVITAKELSEEQPEDNLIDLPEDDEIWT